MYQGRELEDFFGYSCHRRVRRRILESQVSAVFDNKPRQDADSFQPHFNSSAGLLERVNGFIPDLSI